MRPHNPFVKWIANGSIQLRCYTTPLHPLPFPLGGNCTHHVIHFPKKHLNLRKAYDESRGEGGNWTRFFNRNLYTLSSEMHYGAVLNQCCFETDITPWALKWNTLAAVSNSVVYTKIELVLSASTFSRIGYKVRNPTCSNYAQTMMRTRPAPCLSVATRDGTKFQKPRIYSTLPLSRVSL